MFFEHHVWTVVYLIQVQFLYLLLLSVAVVTGIMQELEKGFGDARKDVMSFWRHAKNRCHSQTLTVWTA